MRTDIKTSSYRHCKNIDGNFLFRALVAEPIRMFLKQFQSSVMVRSMKNEVEDNVQVHRSHRAKENVYKTIAKWLSQPFIKG